MRYLDREDLLITAFVRLAPLAALFGLTRFFLSWEVWAT